MSQTKNMASWTAPQLICASPNSDSIIKHVRITAHIKGYLGTNSIKATPLKPSIQLPYPTSPSAKNSVHQLHIVHRSTAQPTEMPPPSPIRQAQLLPVLFLLLLRRRCSTLVCL